MRKLLWMIILFAVYVWIMTSGKEQMILTHGKSLYQAIAAWFDDAEVDYHLQKQPSPVKKRHRRWD